MPETLINVKLIIIDYNIGINKLNTFYPKPYESLVSTVKNGLPA
jgi:hypothetical protein